MTKPLIFVLGGNPAWQKTMFFKKLVTGKVNRAVMEKNYPSGKGINFCRAVHSSGIGETLLFQFAGGINGKRVCEGLDAAGFRHETIETDNETRNCITCLDDSGEMSELIGTSSRITDKDAENLIGILRKKIADADILAITGSLPDGSDYKLYKDAATLAIQHNIPVLIDAVSGTDAVLELDGKVILKVNKEEFLRITGKKDLLEAHRYAAEKFPEKIFAVTDGENPASLSADGKIIRYNIPHITPVSPLGAGDTTSAVMAALIASDTPYIEAFRMALAAASANCLNDTAGEFQKEQWLSIAEKTTVAEDMEENINA